jgi:sigma-B regulation protein RsbU (phosphoserine phosphatase)
MLMAQTAVATLVRSQPAARPRDLIVALNRVLYDTTRNRMGGERHMTLSLLRYHRDGRVVHAGAHMDLVLLRAGAADCELLPTPGTWLAVVDEVGPVTVDSELRLAAGDLLLAYTDGLTEAMRPDGTLFGEERLCAAVLAARRGSPAEIVRAILDAVAAWRNRQEDDVTVVAMRYRGPG